MVTDGEWDSRLCFWRLKIDDLVVAACQAAGRNLRLDEWEQFFPGDDYRLTYTDWPAAEGEAAQDSRMIPDQ